MVREAFSGSEQETEELTLEIDTAMTEIWPLEVDWSTIVITGMYFYSVVVISLPSASRCADNEMTSAQVVADCLTLLPELLPAKLLIFSLAAVRVWLLLAKAAA